MSKQPNREEQRLKDRRNDADFYKMTVLFFALAAVVMLLLKVSSTISLRHASGRNVAYTLYTLFRHPAVIAVVGVLFAAACVWFIVCRVKKKDERYAYFSSLNALLLALYLVVFAAYFGVRIVGNPADCMLFIVMTVVAAALYYIYKIYRPDFFVFSVENAVLSLLLYRCWHVYTVRGTVGKLLVILIAAFWGVYAKKLVMRKASSGKSAAKQGYLLLPYFVTLILWTVFMFIKTPNPTGALLIPSGVMLSVMLAQYVLFAIWYTIRLIRE